jgi:predicted ester cyclase
MISYNTVFAALAARPAYDTSRGWQGGRLMSTEEHKPIHWRCIKEVMNRHHVDRIEEVLRSNYIAYAPSVLSGVAGACQLTAAPFTAFPDLHLAMDDLMAEGDQVVVHLTATGTHQGGFHGLPPTGQQHHLVLRGVAGPGRAGCRVLVPGGQLRHPAPVCRNACFWTNWVSHRCNPCQHRDWCRMPQYARFPFDTRLGTRFVSVLVRVGS